MTDKVGISSKMIFGKLQLTYIKIYLDIPSSHFNLYPSDTCASVCWNNQK